VVYRELSSRQYSPLHLLLVLQEVDHLTVVLQEVDNLTVVHQEVDSLTVVIQEVDPHTVVLQVVAHLVEVAGLQTLQGVDPLQGHGLVVSQVAAGVWVTSLFMAMVPILPCKFTHLPKGSHPN
jgi:hypothetical protein